MRAGGAVGQIRLLADLPVGQPWAASRAI